MIFRSLKLHITIFTVCFSTVLFSQVEIDNTIELNGATPSDRQIENIGTLDSLTAVNFHNKIANEGVFYIGNIVNDTIYVQNKNYTHDDGHQIFVKINSKNSDSIVHIKIANTYFKINRKDNSSISPKEWVDNEIVAFIIKGNIAYINHFTNKTCPSGYLKVNTKYCIEIDQRSAALFYDAVVDCASNDARLCNWGEFFYACQKYSSTSLQNMTDNYEWVDDSANGEKQVRIVGNNFCETIAVGSGLTQNYQYRCCVSLH